MFDYSDGDRHLFSYALYARADWQGLAACKAEGWLALVVIGWLHAETGFMQRLASCVAMYVGAPV